MFYIAGDGTRERIDYERNRKYGLQQRVKMLGNISEPHAVYREYGMLYFYYLFVKCFQW